VWGAHRGTPGKRKRQGACTRQGVPKFYHHVTRNHRRCFLASCSIADTVDSAIQAPAAVVHGRMRSQAHNQPDWPADPGRDASAPKEGENGDGGLVGQAEGYLLYKAMSDRAVTVVMVAARTWVGGSTATPAVLVDALCRGEAIQKAAPIYLLHVVG